MSDLSTTRMLQMYEERAPSPLFLAGFFQTPPENIHNSEKVEIDILREDEKIAIVVQDIATGARLNESTLFTNKSFTPPILKESAAITAYNQMKRQPGDNPFVDPNFGANALREAFRVFGQLGRKMLRTIELMASQTFQTGTVTLKDAAGVDLYVLNFGAKNTHFVTTTAWAEGGNTGNPLLDITNITNVIRRDGKKQPDQLIFGGGAWRRFMANPQVVALFDKMGFNAGLINVPPPQPRGDGGAFMGRVLIGQYVYEMWSYDGYYQDPQTGNFVPYVGDNKVIVRASKGRLDLSFGGIPSFVPPEKRALSFMPPSFSSETKGFAFSTNSWVTPNGEALMLEAGTRPLTIPTALDSFGCLTVF
jgi:hypothetical protein